MQRYSSRFWCVLPALVLLFHLFFVGVPTGYANNASLSLTVTPPLFQLGLQPGERWSSTIQIINTNPYEITVYAEPVLFRPADESGRPEFFVTATGASEPLSNTLADWITVPQGALVVPPEQTRSIPITVLVPTDAPPGGHYAAVLIGNRPPEGGVEGSAVSVASSIASLVLLRVAGDVREQGRIREFSTKESVYQSAEASFTLRFENQGNVHLQPQGDITIYNMFGKTRGYLPINHERGYGNVLPGSIRTFSFTWTSDTGRWDIGRYSAVATLGYGADGKQFVNSTVYFWVLPLKPLAQAGLITFLLLGGFFWFIRTYVRRALQLEAARQGGVPLTPDTRELMPEAKPTEPRLTLASLVRPIQAGIVDLRNQHNEPPVPNHTLPNAPNRRQTQGIASFFVRYRLFFAFALLIALGWLISSAYFKDVLVVERTYEVEVLEEGAQ